MKVFNKIYDIFLGNHSTLSRKVLKKKRNSKILTQSVKYLHQKELQHLNTSIREGNRWLFDKNSRKEIQRLVFSDADAPNTPLLHNNIFYQQLILIRMEEILELQKPKEAGETSRMSSQVRLLRRNLTLSKRSSVAKSREDEGAVPLSAQLNVIPHANEMTDKKFMRTPTIFSAAKEFRRTSSIISPLLKQKTTQNLMFLDTGANPIDSNVLFDQDFILCTVFGYKNVSLILY